MRAGARGASGLFILVILVLVALGVLALTSLSKTTDWTTDRTNTNASLAKAAAALDAFAGASARLPCPANPAVDDGVEVVAANPVNCQFDQGTIPWTTIGMRRDDAFDAWAHKISYRVFDGGKGFTQVGGMSMANCDSVVGTGGPTGSGLCRADHSTVASDFISGKGLTISDFATTYNNGSPTGGAAYVLISHGPSGLGSYTSSGVQLALPKGDEKDNTTATGPFHIEAFSDSMTGDTDPNHFDDILVYRLVTDVVKNANLGARPWAGVLTAVAFDKNTLAAALGSNPNSDTGQSTIAFNNGTVNTTVSAFNSGGAEDISYVPGGGGPDAIGGVGGGNSLLDNSAGEGIRIDFSEDARQFAFTVDQFDDAAALHERLEVRFFEVNGGIATLKATQTESSCASNGKVTSFSLDACSPFNRVEIRPIPMSDTVSPSSFSLAEIRACVDSVTCQTSLQSSGNVCSSKVFKPCSIGINDVSVLTVILANPNGSNTTGAAFSDTYPSGLVNAAVPVAANTCGGTLTAAAGDNGLVFSGGIVPGHGSCTVALNVTSAAASVFNNTTSVITTANAGTLDVVSGTLSALQHPTVLMGFAPASVSTNLPSVLTVTLGNTNATAITGVAFTDTYPTGLVNAAAPAASSTCGGVVAAANGGASLSLSGGTIPPGGCTVAVSVTSASVGTYANGLAAGAVTSGNAGVNLAGTSASLVVN